MPPVDDVVVDQVVDVQTPDVAKPAAQPDPNITSDKTGLRATLQKVTRDVNDKFAAEKLAKESASGKTPDGPPAIKSPVESDADKTRDAKGKFVPKDTTEKPLTEAKPGTEQPKADAAPGTWKPEAKTIWPTLSPVVKAEVLRRETESAREISKAQGQIQQLNQNYGPIEQVLGPKRALWNAQHGGVHKALERLVSISDLASQAPNDFLAYYLSQPDVASRVDLQKVFGGQAPQGSQQADPVVRSLQETVNGLREQLGSFINTHQSSQIQSTEQKVEQFATAMEGDQLLRPHFESVRDQVFSLIPALRSQSPTATVEQILTDAYEIAVRRNPEIAAQIVQEQEERIRSDMEKKARLASAQLANKSVPHGAPPPGKGSAVPASNLPLRELLREKVREYRNSEQSRIN